MLVFMALFANLGESIQNLGHLKTSSSHSTVHRRESNAVNIREEIVGGLVCRVVDVLPKLTSPKLIVVLSHGYGAPGTDLVPFGPELIETSPLLSNHVQFVFPQAPIDLTDHGIPGGRAWWHLDMLKLQMAVATGRFRELRAEQPEGLPEARRLLTALIAEWSQISGVPVTRFVLGGFSQGAMLATDVALHLDDNPAALVILSGSLLNEAEWRSLAPHRKGLLTLQSHGTDDPILPMAGAEGLREMLSDSGLAVEFVSFRGGHGIPAQAFEKVAGLLERLCEQ